MEEAYEPDPLETPHGKFAFEFARALADGQFGKALRMLAPSLRDDFPPSELKIEYEKMFSYCGETKAEDVQVFDDNGRLARKAGL